MSLIITLRFTIILLMIALVGCATPKRVTEIAPSIPVSEAVWRQVDRDIAAESRAATGEAILFARGRMERWRELVGQRAELDFIPWYSSYWTQQWLTAKVAWYNLSSGDDGDAPVGRLATYLQAQFHERVLAPVAREVDPVDVVAQTTGRYVQFLGRQLQTISRHYDVPPDQFERRLESIPAIGLAPPATNNASLYQLVYADPLDSLPAYAALLKQVRTAGAKAGAGLSKTRISPVARRVSEKLLDRLAISGGTSAASALIGGVAGTVFSLGAAGVGLFLHENGREQIETELRSTLNAAMDDMWLILMENPDTGVTAGVYYLSGQIEKSFPQTSVQPVELASPPQEIPLSESLPLLSE